MLWQPEPEDHAYHFTLPEGHANENVMWLHWVVRLRWVAIVAQIITVSFTYKVLAHWWTAPAMLAVTVFLGFWNGHVNRVLEREEDVDSGYILGQLTVDVLALTVLFSLAGGTSNPFVMLYLVHVAMGTIILTAGRAIVLAVIILLSYTSLDIVSWPLHLDRHGIPADLLMMFGQWIGFAVTVFSVGLFVLGTANSLRRHRARAANGAAAPPADEHASAH